MAYFAASVDPVDKNRRFAESLGLDYPILSDVDKSVARAYGVLRLAWAARHTIYIGVDGRVLFIDTAVRAATAGADVARRLEALGLPPRTRVEG